MFRNEHNINLYFWELLISFIFIAERIVHCPGRVWTSLALRLASYFSPNLGCPKQGNPIHTTLRYPKWATYTFAKKEHKALFQFFLSFEQHYYLEYVYKLSWGPIHHAGFIHPTPVWLGGPGTGETKWSSVPVCPLASLVVYRIVTRPCHCGTLNCKSGVANFNRPGGGTSDTL